ncbi:MAG: hypothetical protein M3Q68_10635 [Actinomycetota bacterium]|nr:hypothetical protein [Actinomycetota bacterium]
MPSSRARRAAARKASIERRRRAILGGVVVVGVAGAAATLSPLRSDDEVATTRPRPGEVRQGSEIVEQRTGLVRITDEPSSYRLTYRVDTYGGGERIVTRDELEVRRPFDGRTRKFEGQGGDAPVRSEQIGLLGRLNVPKTAQSDAVVLETGPALAPSDVRIAPVLDDLVASGRVQAREWRAVGGRACQVLRFGGPVSSGTVAPTLEPEEEYADACVSEQGFVLEEVWVRNGLVQRRRVATRIESTAPVGDEAFATSGAPIEPLPVDEGGGSFRPVDPTSSYAAPFWVLDAAPLEAYLGRWAVVSPAGSDPDSDETKDRRLGFVADVWQDGIDTVIVEQGSTSGGVRPFELGAGQRFMVDGLGEGEVVLDLRTSEVRFVRPDGYFVRVRGTVNQAQLVELARQLRRTEGGPELVYL